MPTTDAEIMARVQAGDHELFGVLVTRYAPQLLRVAESKLGDSSLAEDVVQEAFLAAFGARQTYRSEFAFSTWLWTILLNLCRRRYKRQHSSAASLWETGVLGSSNDPRCDPADEQSPPALSLLIADEERGLLHDLLADLPEPQADALRLRFFGGLSFEEIAGTMECSLSGAKRRVKTGLEKLTDSIRTLEQADAQTAGRQQETE